MHRAQQGWRNRLCAVLWRGSAEALPTALRMGEASGLRKLGQFLLGTLITLLGKGAQAMDLS